MRIWDFVFQEIIHKYSYYFFVGVLDMNIKANPKYLLNESETTVFFDLEIEVYR